MTVNNLIASRVFSQVQTDLLQQNYGVSGGEGLRWDLWEARGLSGGELGMIKGGEAGCVRVP